MPATLSLNAIRERCVKFAYDWSDCVGDEKQDGHEFMRELMKCFGITKRKAISYERRSNRASTGRQGYIDALIPGKALIEMKSAGKDLNKAEEQALDYIHDLADVETPRLLIISDFRRIRIVDLGNDMMTADGIDSGHTEFELAKLPDHVDDLKFLAGYGMVQVGSREQEEASIRAARVMADLYEALDGSGYSDHEASIFLIRTLFCLYGDDAGLWERDLFAEFLDARTREDGSDLGAQLALLYQTLNTPVERRQSTLDELISRFPYVNGGIFAEPLSIPSFSSAMREELVRACAFDWSGISPAVFGSLFQAVKSPQARRELGEHYTSETNILKTLGPLFLDDLQERFAEHTHDLTKLKELRQELRDLRIMDPACGCGNFLVVAYRALRGLDTDILKRIRELELARKNNDEFQATMFFDDRENTLRSWSNWTTFSASRSRSGRHGSRRPPCIWPTIRRIARWSSCSARPPRSFPSARPPTSRSATRCARTGHRCALRPRPLGSSAIRRLSANPCVPRSRPMISASCGAMVTTATSTT